MTKMKNANSTSQMDQAEVSQASNEAHLSFNEIVVYQEMSDQPAVRLNLIQQIHAQMNQLDEMLERKQFILKEIYHEIVK